MSSSTFCCRCGHGSACARIYATGRTRSSCPGSRLFRIRPACIVYCGFLLFSGGRILHCHNCHPIPDVSRFPGIVGILPFLCTLPAMLAVFAALTCWRRRCVAATPLRALFCNKAQHENGRWTTFRCCSGFPITAPLPRGSGGGFVGISPVMPAACLSPAVAATTPAPAPAALPIRTMPLPHYARYRRAATDDMPLRTLPFRHSVHTFCRHIYRGCSVGLPTASIPFLPPPLPSVRRRAPYYLLARWLNGARFCSTMAVSAACRHFVPWLRTSLLRTSTSSGQTLLPPCIRLPCGQTACSTRTTFTMLYCHSPTIPHGLNFCCCLFSYHPYLLLLPL